MVNTITQTYSRGEQQEIGDFEKDLVENIRRSREVFFGTGDSWLERRENEEVREREKRGDREFNYRSSISTLVQNLSSIEPGKRGKIMRTVAEGVIYRITGIYVDGFKSFLKNPPLLADIARNPLEYL